jgi:hypothetical protein
MAGGTAMVRVVAVGAQSAPSPPSYERLTAAQRHLVEGWDPGAFDAAPAAFRAAFGRVTGAISSLVLFDPENGEVLGSVLDLVDAVALLADQPVPGGDAVDSRLVVTLTSGALDRLRRSAEFARVGEGSDAVYVRPGPPEIRISIVGGGERGVIVVSGR